MNKNMKIFVILGLAAGALLIILSFTASGGRNNASDENRVRIDSRDFVREQEEKLKEILNRIDGVSEPFVMITLANSSQHIYAVRENIKENSRNGENLQREVSRDIIFHGDSEQPLLIKEIEPRIKGVAVICRGISSPDMQLKIINLVSTVLNLPTNRVYVISAD